MKKDKFESFSHSDRELIINDDEIKYEEVKILDPNNPIKQIDAILIRFDIQ